MPTPPPPPLTPTTPIRFRTLLALATTSAFLLWLAFAVGGLLSALAFVALVPLMLLARLPAKVRPLYTAAYLGGFAFYALGLYWLGYAAPEWWQALLMVVALAGYCALYFPAFLVAAR